MGVFALDQPIRLAQLRRLQSLWHAWTSRLRLAHDADRELRHYFVELFSAGRARATLQLTRADAALVIAWLERLTRAAHTNRIAGTAGRRGFAEHRRMPPTRAAWRALWAHAAALGLTRAQLDRFIARHYASRGLRSVADIRSMADLNRVLWGLKAILRRTPPSASARKAA
jgi:hypothetical protein